MAASSMSDRHRPVLPLPVMPDADGVGDEVARVVEDRVVEWLAGVGVVGPAEVEEAQLLEVLHGLSYAEAQSGYRAGTRDSSATGVTGTGSQLTPSRLRRASPALTIHRLFRSVRTPTLRAASKLQRQRQQRIFCPQHDDVAGVVALGDVAGEERRAQAPDFVAIEVAHGVAQHAAAACPGAG